MYDCVNRYSVLEFDIVQLGLDVNKLFGIRPTTASIGHRSVGIIPDASIPYHEEDPDDFSDLNLFILEATPAQYLGIDFDSEDPDVARWYLSPLRPTSRFTHLGAE